MFLGTQWKESIFQSESRAIEIIDCYSESRVLIIELFD
mgnify:CR=1 FL=1